jgi:hypothetical protein
LLVIVALINQQGRLSGVHIPEGDGASRLTPKRSQTLTVPACNGLGNRLAMQFHTLATATHHLVLGVGTLLRVLLRLPRKGLHGRRVRRFQRGQLVCEGCGRGERGTRRRPGPRCGCLRVQTHRDVDPACASATTPFSAAAGVTTTAARVIIVGSAVVVADAGAVVVLAVVVFPAHTALVNVVVVVVAFLAIVITTSRCRNSSSSSGNSSGRSSRPVGP